MARFACLGLGLLYLNLQVLSHSCLEYVLSIQTIKYRIVEFGLLWQEAADVMMEALKAIPGQVGQYCLFTVETCAYAARLVTSILAIFHFLVDDQDFYSGNVMKIQKMLGVCAEHLEENNSHQAVAALGIALISMGEEVIFQVLILSHKTILKCNTFLLYRLEPRCQRDLSSTCCNTEK